MDKTIQYRGFTLKEVSDGWEILSPEGESFGVADDVEEAEGQVDLGISMKEMITGERHEEKE